MELFISLFFTAVLSGFITDFAQTKKQKILYATLLAIIFSILLMLLFPPILLHIKIYCLYGINILITNLIVGMNMLISEYGHLQLFKKKK
ncbi:hypothetical protein [Suttonella ornithocola]|uniref:Uncharacterized protein n=1 Tax=Suttonella ornithocola TaxID=279832 RepID=A0A380MPK9_9GAMM|nr:hypothetical protein [Suttonella ornithocola]SUO93227.1 Uncharacterised protein [Suttonella ornithocola]